MRKSLFPGTTGVFCLFFIPYIITIIFNGINTALINNKFDLEMAMPILVAGQIRENYELETIKSQTIIARSNFCQAIKEQDNLGVALGQIKKEVNEEIIYRVLKCGKYEKAVEETAGEILTCENELKQVPYHEISAGQTRDGEEVFHSKEGSYLKSVHSDVDKESKDFLNSIYINKNILPKELKIKARDSAGYVTEILADGKVLEGESFRKGMGLTSANFTMQEIGDQIRFLCKGKGHGMGLSQYGADNMARNGSSDEDILEYYFPEMKIQQIDYKFFE